MQLTKKATSDLHKILYLCKTYPKHSIKQLVGLLVMNPIDTNCALWRAQDEGYITITSDHYKIHKLPEQWEMGDEVLELMTQMTYLFERMARDKGDLSEEQLDVWCSGNLPQDQLIARNMLIENEILGTYDIYDPKDESTYKFYTLASNVGKRWGESHFKDKSDLR